MTLEQFGNLGEAVGGIAVVVSLIALVIQIRHNTRAIRAESARAAEADWSARNSEYASHLPFDLVLKVHTAQSIDEFSPQEQLHTQTLLRSVWHQLTSEYYLYREGMYDRSIWERRLGWFRGFIEIPVVGYFFEEERRVLLDPGLYQEVMSMTKPEDINLPAIN